MKNMNWKSWVINVIVAKITTETSNSIMNIVPPPGTKDKIIDLVMNNTGIRDTARSLHISINAVVHTLKKLAKAGDFFIV